MEKKKIITVALTTTVILAGLIFIIINQNKLSQLSLGTESDVCSYLSKIPPYDCDNYECNVKNGKDNYWKVFYRCPGPENFPPGQGYLLNVDKNTGNIEVEGLTN